MAVLYDFRGDLNNQVLRNILKELDEKMADIGEERFLRKKINSILIECLQNLIFHAETSTDDPLKPHLVVTKTGQTYEIVTQNLIHPSRVSALANYLDKINSMNEEELRLYYQEVLTNGRFNPQGGAGLGIINIARKAKDNKLQYRFSTANDSRTLYELRVVV